MIKKIFFILFISSSIFSLLFGATAKADSGSCQSRADRIRCVAEARAKKIEEMGKTRREFNLSLGDLKVEKNNAILIARDQNSGFERRQEINQIRFDNRQERRATRHDFLQEKRSIRQEFRQTMQEIRFGALNGGNGEENGGGGAAEDENESEN